LGGDPGLTSRASASLGTGHRPLARGRSPMRGVPGAKFGGGARDAMTGPTAIVTTVARELAPLLDHSRLGPLVRRLRSGRRDPRDDECPFCLLRVLAEELRVPPRVEQRTHDPRVAGSSPILRGSKSPDLPVLRVRVAMLGRHWISASLAAEPATRPSGTAQSRGMALRWTRRRATPPPAEFGGVEAPAIHGYAVEGWLLRNRLVGVREPQAF